MGAPQQPIVFTGTTKQPGSWQGIRIDNGGVAELRYCDIGYGGNWGPASSSGMLSTQSSSLAVSNCRIHDSSSAGILVVGGAKPTIRNHSIENNKLGLNALFPLEQVDARFNWWGHAGGPKHEDNPNGQGQEILGDVAFEPWLRSPDETPGGNTGITVDLSGPGRYAPGDTIVYSIFYYNGTPNAIDNAVLRFGMPANAVLLDASLNSVFPIERNHVFWKLGSLSPNAQGLAWVRVQYDWGLPDGMKTATAAQLSGTNLPAPVFNVNDYLTYTPRTLQALSDLSQAQVDQLRATSAELEKLYQGALAGEFKFAAEQHSYSTGEQEVEIRMLRFNPQMALLSLWLTNNNAQQGAQDKLEVAANSDEECDECRQAKDPNEMYGPAGDLLPGQLATYEIAYENIGEGTAFGVFIMNKLPEGVFDIATLQINNGGAYSAGSKSISWDVGDLAPKGQPGATGKVSYSVRLRSDLPSGTPVVNSSVVHFPSVPEETPTNRLVNLIRPLVAEPQSLQTEAGAAIPITLGGRDAVGTPLAFSIVDGPMYGTLSGTAPDLVYTPDAGVTGLDRIRFSAGNGVQTATADVAIRILPSSGDVTGPTVLWTAPKPQTQVVLAAAIAGADNSGSYYYPTVQAQFSEAVAPATVNSQSVLVTDATGKSVKADVRYDAGIDQLQLLLREEPRPGMTYTVTITMAVKDLRGNALAANHAWSFTVAGIRQPAGPPTVYLPLVKR